MNSFISVVPLSKGSHMHHEFRIRLAEMMWEAPVKGVVLLHLVSRHAPQDLWSAFHRLYTSRWRSLSETDRDWVRAVVDSNQQRFSQILSKTQPHMRTPLLLHFLASEGDDEVSRVAQGLDAAPLTRKGRELLQRLKSMIPQ